MEKGIHKEKLKKQKRKSSFRENCVMIIEVLVFVLFINAFLVQSYAIPTPSMEDNMLVGDHLLVDKVTYSCPINAIESLLLPYTKIERGMIVVFKAPPEIKAKNRSQLIYVKRVIGLPGENIKIIKNKVYINGNALDEPYIFLNGRTSVPPNFPPEYPIPWWDEFPLEYRNSLVETEIGVAFQIPKNHYFCMGDNRRLSADSRIWGPLPADYIIGKPWRNYWSYEETSQYYLNRNLFNRIKDFILHFFTKTRWNRILKKF